MWGEWGQNATMGVCRIAEDAAVVILDDGGQMAVEVVPASTRATHRPDNRRRRAKV